MNAIFYVGTTFTTSDG